MRIFRGTPVSPGYGHGRAVPYRRSEFLFAAAASAVAQDSVVELRRVEAARVAARRELNALATSLKQGYGLDEGHIFHAQFLILEDEHFTGLIRDHVTKGRSAEAAVVEAVRQIEEMFRKQVNPYLRERSIDVHDVGARILGHLVDRCTHPFSRLPDAAVIVADQLLPSDTVALERGRVRAIVTAQGSANSHAAILARALGIPAVTAVEGILDACTLGDAISVDGEAGDVILHIEGKTQADYIHRARHYRLALEEARRITGHSAMTVDAVEISLLANVDREEDIEGALERDAAGIGLLRTEFLYLAEGGESSEQRQAETYRYAARRLAGRPVTIRILDLTPDKVLALSGDVPQVGASLLDRSVHYALAHPEILRPQLRAILRAAPEGNLRILLPGVTGPGEIDTFRAFLRQVADEVWKESSARAPRFIPVGAMIETAAALLMVDAIAESADFLSLGTNDLLCHLFGRERHRGRENAYEPSLLRAIDFTVQAARSTNKPLSVCGEMAGEPAFTALLIGLGIRELSMSPERLPEVRYNVSRISATQASTLSRRALALPNGSEVKRLLAEHIDPWHQMLSEEQRDS
jgi:phosphoenolpyruvate-protein phosphotransferase